MNTVEPRYFELAYFELFASLNSSFFPYTLNQPRYFDLVKNRVRTKEHSWKRIAFYLSWCCVINNLTMLDSRAVSR